SRRWPRTSPAVACGPSRPSVTADGSHRPACCRWIPARGGIQDHPPAPPLPAAPDGAADRAHLAGGRRGGARAAARLHDPVDPPGRSPSGVSEEAANRETLRRLEGSKVRTAVTLDVFGQLTKQGRLGLG